MSNSLIRHSGIIHSIKSEEIEVLIFSESGCSSCKSKNYCSVAESKEKIIRINKYGHPFKVGDQVNVTIEEKTGLLAILFAYLIPFVVMISFLLIGYYYKMNEPLMGLGVIGLLTIYYIIIYTLRGFFGKRITFSIEELQTRNKLN